MVLTAGHCVTGSSNWLVTVAGVSVQASSATVFDYFEQGEQLNFKQHDIGLLFLDKPISLSRFPTIATSPLPSGSRVFNVGRIRDGVQHDRLFGRETVSHGRPLVRRSTMPRRS